MNRFPPRKNLLVLGVCSMLALSIAPSLAHADPLGVPGQNGPSGMNGANGANGQDTTIVANGQAQALSLAGQNGSDGTSAYNGSNANGCHQPRDIRADLFGAPGGNGGNAGMGGTGGSGGNLTIYYTDIQSLQLITVNASPGAGGISGSAGAGGAPCECDNFSWSVPIQTCVDVPSPPPAGGGGNPPPPGNGGGHSGPAPQPNPPVTTPPAQPGPRPEPPKAGPPGTHASIIHAVNRSIASTVCTTSYENHTCSNGSYGNNGFSYANGSPGAYGMLTIIQSATPLTPTQPSAQAQFGTFPQMQTLTLDKWTIVPNGATQLLGAGSLVSDSYRVYAGRVTTPVNFVWNNARPQQNFNTQFIGTSVDDTGKINAFLANATVFADISVSYDANGAATVSVNHAAVPSETTQLSGTLTGDGQNVIVQLKDTANISDFITTTMHAIVKSDGILSHTRYDDMVPANLIVSNGAGGMTVEIGKLAGIPSGDIAKGKKLSVQLDITRSLGGNSATQTISITNKLN